MSRRAAEFIDFAQDRCVRATPGALWRWPLLASNKSGKECVRVPAPAGCRSNTRSFARPGGRYIGHLGVGGVGDTKGVLESEMRQRHIKWIVNAKVDKVDADKMHVTEVDEDGKPKKAHELPFKFSMMIPAFRGIAAVRGIDGLVNPRGFIIVDKHHRNPKYRNVFGVGVCIAIAPLEQTPLPVGVPKTGYMIESMVTATALNIGQLVRGEEATHEATWNAICLADFGDSGVAFVAMPQNPPRNVNWASSGRWVHVAKVAFEKYFLHKVRAGTTEPYYEKMVMRLLDIGKIKRPAA